MGVPLLRAAPSQVRIVAALRWSAWARVRP